jgi:hypothetical protein
MRSIRIKQLGNIIITEPDKEFIDINILLVDNPNTQDIYE